MIDTQYTSEYLSNTIDLLRRPCYRGCPCCFDAVSNSALVKAMLDSDNHKGIFAALVVCTIEYYLSSPPPRSSVTVSADNICAQVLCSHELTFAILHSDDQELINSFIRSFREIAKDSLFMKQILEYPDVIVDSFNKQFKDAFMDDFIALKNDHPSLMGVLLDHPETRREKLISCFLSSDYKDWFVTNIEELIKTCDAETSSYISLKVSKHPDLMLAFRENIRGIVNGHVERALCSTPNSHLRSSIATQ